MTEYKVESTINDDYWVFSTLEDAIACIEEFMNDEYKEGELFLYKFIPYKLNYDHIKIELKNPFEGKTF